MMMITLLLENHESNELDFNAVLNGVVVGAAGFSINEESVELNWFFIEEEFRGQGMASKLGKAVKAQLELLGKEFGIQTLTLEVQPSIKVSDFDMQTKEGREAFNLVNATESAKLVDMYTRYFGCTMDEGSTFRMSAKI